MSDFTPFSWKSESLHPATGLKYRTRTADFVMRDDAGQLEGTMFTYSYTLLPEDKKRPVLFAYNGGPGADSNWVHMGFLGPQIIDIPGYPNTDIPAQTNEISNPDFLLDVCDIVCINPVGTDKTILGEAGEGKFFSAGGDADSFVRLIKNWLKENDREESPVYLCGESYGTIRNLVVADRLPKEVHLKGVIFIGVSFNVGARGILYVEPNVRRLCADAATVWYHYHQNEMTKEAFIREAHEFAYGPYAHALLIGNKLPEEEKQAIAEKLHRYTNLDVDFLLDHKLKFAEGDFLQNVIKDGVISTYDSRVTLKRSQMTSDGKDESDFNNEPFMAKFGGQVDRAMEDYTKECLSVPDNRPRVDLMKLAYGWDYFAVDKDFLQLPESLMKDRQDLTFMLANGYYDMQSTFDFVLHYLSQYDLPEDRTMVRFYDAGHAVYIGGLAHQLICDIREFLKMQR